jgi:anhydro-N-acetylmuramic acid kinase
MEKMVGTRINPIRGVGMMSGTSLDGIDLAYVHFWEEDGWKFSLEHTHYQPYNLAEQKELNKLRRASSADLLAAHAHWGRRFGKEIHAWLQKLPQKPHFVASHGHTIFHQPDRGFTFQLGDGIALQQEVQLPVVYDFRSADVAAGGQGAPLVPFGEFHLFPEYDHFLNLGGIANGSSRLGSEMQASDISFANMWFNHSAKKLGLQFDENGNEAKKGVVSQPLFEQLLTYSRSIQCSLSAELAKPSFEFIDSANISPQDELRTSLEVLLEVFRHKWPIHGKVLVTGGGAKNSFLMQRLNETQSAHFGAASPQLIDFKEALIFAFLGVLRSQEKVNVFPSVTGASYPTSGGIYLPY